MRPTVAESIASYLHAHTHTRAQTHMVQVMCDTCWVWIDSIVLFRYLSRFLFTPWVWPFSVTLKLRYSVSVTSSALLLLLLLLLPFASQWQHSIETAISTTVFFLSSSSLLLLQSCCFTFYLNASIKYLWLLWALSGRASAHNMLLRATALKTVILEESVCLSLNSLVCNCHQNSVLLFILTCRIEAMVAAATAVEVVSILSFRWKLHFLCNLAWSEKFAIKESKPELSWL